MFRTIIDQPDKKEVIELFQNKDVWGDQGDYIFIKGSELLAVDTFFDEANSGLLSMTHLKSLWSPAGVHYEFLIEKEIRVEISKAQTIPNPSSEWDHITGGVGHLNIISLKII